MKGYTVQVLGNHMIVKADHGGPIRCGWDTLQRLKNEYLGEQTLAVEVFPPESEVVDEANQRHLWVVSEAPSLFHRNYQPSSGRGK